MFHKIKLYSLLLIIVLSTIIGLMGAPSALADGDTVYLNEDESEAYLNDKKDPAYKKVSDGEAEVYKPNLDGDSTKVVYIKELQPGSTDDAVEIIYLDGNNEYHLVRLRLQLGGGYSVESGPDALAKTSIPPGEEPPGGDGDTGGGGDAETEEKPKTCQVDGIGWIICPTFTFLAWATDSVYSVLDKVFLRLPPVNMDINDDSNGMYRSWRMMRDAANIIFVIAFLFIVFSQITSIGISNYGLKQLVPKLIISAILVNTSYFICALAVDVSNVLGSALKDLLDSASGGILTEDSETAWNSGIGFRSFVATALITVGAGVALATWATLPIVGAALLFVLPIALATLVTMIVRQALVVLLIVIAPFAFVALLFPNTEGYFKRWQDLFKAMLLLYPIVALVFGASALASTVLMAAAKDTGSLAALHGIAAATVRILPLVFIPALMKISSGIFGRVTGMVNDRQKGWFDNVRNTRMENHQNDLSKRAMLRSRDPYRRKRLDALHPLGSAMRSEKRKAKQQETESLFQGSFLNTEEGVAARNAAENARQRLQNAEISAETVRISGAEGGSLVGEQVIAEMRKQTAQDSAQTAALEAIPTAIAANAKQAEIDKGSAELDVKSRGLSSLASTADGRESLRDAKEAEISNKAIEDRAQSAALSSLATTPTGRSALQDAKSAEFLNKAAEDRAQSVGLLGTATTIAAGSAKTAELERKTAENRLDTGAAEHVSRGTRVAAYESGLEKENIENRKEAAAIRAASNDLKVRSEASSELLSAANSEVKQAYEEAIAGSPPSGTAASSVAQAQFARRDSNITSGATESAKRVSQQDFSEQVLRDSSLAREIGGIDRHGKTRAEARAASTISGAFEDAVSNEKKTMSKTAPGELDRIMRDTTQSTERRAAAASTLVKTGSTNDVIKTINYLGESHRRGTANIGDIQQQVIADIGSRKPVAVGASAVAALGRGEFDSTMDELMRGRILSGKVNASTVASMPVEEIDHMIDVIGRSAGLRARPEYAALQAQIREYLTNAQLKGQQPAGEITDRMRIIAP